MSSSSIPVGKVARAMKIAKAGTKMAQNTVAHFAKKSIGMEAKREDLDKNNARDLYRELGEMKGSVLKMAQMLSQDENLLPEAYQDQFKMAQYSAPPLSYPLVKKVFRQEFQKSPEEIFDHFEKDASHAASIGQVHVAMKDGQKLAVKVQYPGVADSISSDLKLVKPFASKVMGFNQREIEHYFSEVEMKMLEETQYSCEAAHGLRFSNMLSHRKELHFPKYFTAYSTDRILTMEYLEGQTLDVFAKHASQAERNRIGKILWDVFDEQIRVHRSVHADPHPGNFQVGTDGRLQLLDFGCVKDIPESFFAPFFELMNPIILENPSQLEANLMQLDLIHPEDNPLEKKFFTEVYQDLILLLGRPFFQDRFDFGDPDFFRQIMSLSDRLQKSKIYKGSKKGRGQRDGLYVNRTYFGLYNLLRLLKADIQTGEALDRGRVVL
jgi:predicted unusual protein kinase regulating ubiquinone biosynthesis (AarF/ABC1/UbiB family)